VNLRTCYTLLGLPETASDSEVKRRYRQLAMIYHPDKYTGDLQKFIQIKEAYQHIINRRNATITTNTRVSKTTTFDRIRKAKEQKRQREYQEFIENERYFRQLISGKRWLFMRCAARLGIVLSIFIIIDTSLPYNYISDRIIAYDPIIMNGLNYNVYASQKIYTQSGRRHYVQKIPNIHSLDADIVILQSKIFRNDLAYITLYHKNGNRIDYTNKNNFFWIQFSLGAHSILLLPFILLPAVIVLFPKKTFVFTFFYFIALYLSIPVMCFYLLFNYRWLHLLSIGLI